MKIIASSPPQSAMQLQTSASQTTEKQKVQPERVYKQPSIAHSQRRAAVKRQKQPSLYRRPPPWAIAAPRRCEVYRGRLTEAMRTVVYLVMHPQSLSGYIYGRSPVAKTCNENHERRSRCIATENFLRGRGEGCPGPFEPSPASPAALNSCAVVPCCPSGRGVYPVREDIVHAPGRVYE